MKNIFRINSQQILNLWRNIAYGLMAVALLILLTSILPNILAPVISTTVAFILYLYAYSGNNSRKQNCVVHITAIFFSIFTYTIILVLLNLASIWLPGFSVWTELTFLTGQYIPILILGPTAFVTCLFVVLRGKESSVCTDCMLTNGPYRVRGRIGMILHKESHLQLVNLTAIFALITVLTFVYYLYGYNPTNITARDMFVFCWLPIVLLFVDIVYFAIRYYNLYLDLRESDQILTPSELSEMQETTWVRYYVICEDSLFLDMTAHDELNESQSESVVETPFIVKRKASYISDSEAASIIRHLTGIRDGKIRLFYGRRSPDNFKQSVNRYFYFLPGKLELYPDLNDVEGTWVDSHKIKELFHNPDVKLSPLLRTDITRLATIIITAKTFNERGERRTKLRQYHPTFTFEELPESKLDFQDNSWLRVSCFNCDTPHYRLRRLWRALTRRHKYPSTIDESNL